MFCTCLPRQCSDGVCLFSRLAPTPREVGVLLGLASGGPSGAPAPAVALWTSLGVAPGSARMRRLSDLSRAAVFDDGELLEQRRQALATAVGPEAARCILLRAPQLLTSDLARNSGLARVKKKCAPQCSPPSKVLSLSHVVPSERLISAYRAGFGTLTEMPREGTLPLAPRPQRSDLERSVPERIATLKALLPSARPAVLLMRAPALLKLPEAQLLERLVILDALLVSHQED